MGNRLYIGNLSYTLTQDDLKNAFNSSGSVTFVRLMTDRETGQSRGFGFVQMSSDNEARQAIIDWDGKELGGRRIVVNEAREKTDAPAGAPRSFSPPRSPAGPPVEVYSRSGGGVPSGARPQARANRTAEKPRRNSKDFSRGYGD